MKDPQNETTPSPTVGIRYTTPNGVEAVWFILRSALNGATPRAYLAHWHPEYTFIGVEGAETPADNKGDKSR